MRAIRPDHRTELRKAYSARVRLLSAGKRRQAREIRTCPAGVDSDRAGDDEGADPTCAPPDHDGPGPRDPNPDPD